MDSTEALSQRSGIYTNGSNCLKQEGFEVVARDGIEPPTPAFSGLRSTTPILLKSLIQLARLGSKNWV